MQVPKEQYTIVPVIGGSRQGKDHVSRTLAHPLSDAWWLEHSSKIPWKPVASDLCDTKNAVVPYEDKDQAQGWSLMTKVYHKEGREEYLALMNTQGLADEANNEQVEEYKQSRAYDLGLDLNQLSDMMNIRAIHAALSDRLPARPDPSSLSMYILIGVTARSSYLNPTPRSSTSLSLCTCRTVRKMLVVIRTRSESVTAALVELLQSIFGIEAMSRIVILINDSSFSDAKLDEHRGSATAPDSSLYQQLRRDTPENAQSAAVLLPFCPLINGMEGMRKVLAQRDAIIAELMKAPLITIPKEVALVWKPPAPTKAVIEQRLETHIRLFNEKKALLASEVQRMAELKAAHESAQTALRTAEENVEDKFKHLGDHTHIDKSWEEILNGERPSGLNAKKQLEDALKAQRRASLLLILMIRCAPISWFGLRSHLRCAGSQWDPQCRV